MSGLLILVVGPSGAGKDTVLRHAQSRLAKNPTIHFTRRAITRPLDASEDHEPLTLAEFSARHFALQWQAHGLHYGIPNDIEVSLATGHTVIANVSRTILDEAGKTYPCFIIEITAPPALLAIRLAARSRESPTAIAARLARVQPGFQAGAVIVNDRTPKAAGKRFIELITQAALLKKTAQKIENSCVKTNLTKQMPTLVLSRQENPHSHFKRANPSGAR